MQNNKKFSIKNDFKVFFIFLLGLFNVLFVCLFLDTTNITFLVSYGIIFKSVLFIAFIFLTVLTVYFYLTNKPIVYKSLLVTLICTFFVFLFLFLLNKLGFSEKFSSINEFREYVSSFNNLSVVVFIIVQFLQVAILPIPSFITVGAGVLLFGPLKASFYSLIGIILGSISAYFIGKLFGFKVAKWLVGEKELKTWLKKVEGKDKIFLTFMFLFPFFPDDILCFVAGISSIKPLYFIIMTLITRSISVFSSCFSINNNLIPYNTWWGIVIWAILIAFFIIITVYVFKNGDKINNFILKLKNHRKNQ